LPQKKDKKNGILWWTTLGLLLIGLALITLLFRSSDNKQSQALVDKNLLQSTTLAESSVTNTKAKANSDSVITQTTLGSQGPNKNISNRALTQNKTSRITTTQIQTNVPTTIINSIKTKETERESATSTKTIKSLASSLLLNKSKSKSYKQQANHTKDETQNTRSHLKKRDQLNDKMLAKKINKLQYVPIIPKNNNLPTSLSYTTTSISNPLLGKMASTTNTEIASGLSFGPRVGYSRSLSSITLGLGVDYAWRIASKIALGLQLGADYIPTNYSSRSSLSNSENQGLATGIGSVEDIDVLGMDTLNSTGIEDNTFNQETKRVTNLAYDNANLNTTVFTGITLSYSLTENITAKTSAGFEIHPFQKKNFEILDANSAQSTFYDIRQLKNKNVLKYLELNLDYKLSKNSGLFIGYHLTEQFRFNTTANFNTTRVFVGIRIFT